MPSTILDTDLYDSQDKTTDWKIIGISVNDPLSAVVDSKSLLYIPLSTKTELGLAIDDLEKYRPGLKQTFYDWFVVSTPFGEKPSLYIEKRYQVNYAEKPLVLQSPSQWQSQHYIWKHSPRLQYGARHRWRKSRLLARPYQW